MSGFEARIEELRSRGKDATAVGGQTTRADLDSVPEALPPDLPGAEETAGEAGMLAAHWEKELRELADRAKAYGQEILDAAARYERNEDAAARALSDHMPRPGGPI